MKLKNVAFVRATAFEELRQKVKWADWNIGSLMIVEESIKIFCLKILMKDIFQRGLNNGP